MRKRDVLFLFIYLTLAIIGIFTIPFPGESMFFVVLALGIILAAWGAVTFVQYRLSSRENKKTSNAAISLLCLAAGILLLIFCKGAAEVFIPVIIGVWAIASGVLSAIDASLLRKTRGDIVLALVSMIISFIVGFIILTYVGMFRSFNGSVLGIYMVVFGAVQVIETSYTGRKLRPAA